MTPNWAQQFYDMLIELRMRGRDYRAAHANRGTPERLHKGNHSRWVPDRLHRGRFTTPHNEAVREQIRQSSVLRIAGPNPTPARLADAHRVVYCV